MSNHSVWKRRARMALCWAVPGAMALGTSCVEDIRLSIVSAGLDFVEGTAGTILETVIPVEDFLPAE